MGQAPSNATIVRQLPQRDQLKAELRQIIADERRLATRRAALEELVGSLEATDVVHAKVAIRARENQGGRDVYGAVATEIGRWAEVWPNVRRRGLYGLTIAPMAGFPKERFCGSGWDRTSARAAALDWVALGTEPEPRLAARS